MIVPPVADAAIAEIVRAAIAAEREACAKIVETAPAIMLRKDVAALIRARE